ncbi:MAG: single-stranded DNA-binding protein [Anaerovoracaceae bacterium]
MNSVQLVGRFTRDPEVRYADSGVSIARFNLAVDRQFKKEGGDTADFIGCIAFGKTAEFVEKYFRKGTRIGINGRIQTGSYTNKDGVKVYTTDVVVDKVEFVESKSSSGTDKDTGGYDQSNGDGFTNIPEGIDEELPFS